MTYSHDLRKKTLDYIEKGGSRQLASEIFGVTTRTIQNWMHRQKLGILPAKMRQSSPSKIDNDKLKKYIENHPDHYLREIAKAFGSTLQAVFYACKRLKITLKKRHRIIKKEMRKNENSL